MCPSQLIRFVHPSLKVIKASQDETDCITLFSDVIFSNIIDKESKLILHVLPTLIRFVLPHLKVIKLSQHEIYCITVFIDVTDAIDCSFSISTILCLS